MTTLPLRLEFSVFDHVLVEAVAEYEEGGGEPEPQVELTLAHSPENSEEWVIWLTIEIPETAKPMPPYAIELRAFGVFAVAGDLGSQAETARLVAVNGGSILYSSAREFLLMVTSRGPSDSYALPTHDFREHPFDVLVPDDDASPDDEDFSCLGQEEG